MRARSPHAAHLDRWLGPGEAEAISRQMRGWYGPPLLVAVPGAQPLLAHGDGDFSGVVKVGGFASLLDRVERVLRRVAVKQASTLNAGFSSLSDLIQEATANGKARPPLLFNKTGSTGAVGGSSTLWRAAGQPSAGAASAAAPGGSPLTKASAGAFMFENAAGGDTLHVVAVYPSANVLGNTLLLYDRLFSVAKTMNSTATEAVTGVPTRYQNTTAGAVDSAEGNFVFPDVVSALPATAHNWTVCQYTNQAGVAAQVIPSFAGAASAGANRIDSATQFFMPLQAGDTGIKALTQMQCSALVATGAIDFVIGHALMWCPCPVANAMIPADGLNDVFSLPRVFDDACLSFLEITKPTGTATVYNGSLALVAG